MSTCSQQYSEYRGNVPGFVNLKVTRAGVWLMAWILCSLGIISSVNAAVFDTTFCNVTTRTFSVVWASDEVVTDAMVRVFADDQGLVELTGSLAVDLSSATVSMAHSQGLVKVDVTGLTRDTLVYIQTETTGVSGTVFYPQAPPYLPVRTALSIRKANASDAPIVSDLITHDVFAPDGVTPSEGTLLLATVPSVSDYPLCAFAGDHVSAPAAVVDLNNLFEAATGLNAELVSGETLQLTEFRGLLCSADAQALVRFRRVPVHEESPAITEQEAAGTCFTGADFNCDSCVDPADFNEFLIRFGLVNQPPDCRFNADYDLSGDDRIDPIDFNELLMAYGVCE